MEFNKKLISLGLDLKNFTLDIFHLGLKLTDSCRKETFFSSIASLETSFSRQTSRLFAYMLKVLFGSCRVKWALFEFPARVIRVCGAFRKKFHHTIAWKRTFLQTRYTHVLYTYAIWLIRVIYTFPFCVISSSESLIKYEMQINHVEAFKSGIEPSPELNCYD